MTRSPWLVAGVAAALVGSAPSTVAAAPGAYAIAVQTDGPIAFYRFFEPAGASSADDFSGNAHTATFSATGITLEKQVTEGDTGAEFANGRVVIPNAPEFTVTEVTLEAVLAWYGDTGVVQRVIDRATSMIGALPVYSMAITTAGNVVAELRLEGITFTATGLTQLTPCLSYHLAATYDGSSVLVYVNGVQDGSQQATGSIFQTATTDIGIGNQADRDRAFSGAIDEAAIYGVALTPGQLLAHAGAIPNLGNDVCNPGGTGGAAGTGGGAGMGGGAGAGAAGMGGSGGDPGVDASAGASGSAAGAGGQAGAGAGGASSGAGGAAGASPDAGTPPPKKKSSSDDDGGCGCRAAGGRAGGPAWLFLAAYLASRLRRRRAG